MTFVVTEACVNCRYTDCVTVCPVDCFRAGPNFVVIHPDECIDCGVCVPECPVSAIYAEAEVPLDQAHFIALNARFAEVWRPINTREPALPDAEVWRERSSKSELIES